MQDDLYTNMRQFTECLLSVLFKTYAKVEFAPEAEKMTLERDVWTMSAVILQGHRSPLRLSLHLHRRPAQSLCSDQWAVLSGMVSSLANHIVCECVRVYAQFVFCHFSSLRGSLLFLIFFFL